MKSKNLVLIVVIGAILLLGGCGCGGYNKMVGMCRVNTSAGPT